MFQNTKNYVLIYKNTEYGNSTLLKESDNQNEIFTAFSDMKFSGLYSQKAIYRKITHEKQKSIINYIIETIKSEV